MAPNRVEQYRRWFEYEKDSHRKVLASLESVPQDQHTSASFHKALDIMDHIIAARRMWLFRFGAATEHPPACFRQGLHWTTWPAISRPWSLAGARISKA